MARATFSVGYGTGDGRTTNKARRSSGLRSFPQIDTTSNAGDGGSGFQMLDPGTYQVSEAGSTSPATNLGDYDRSVVCKDATLNVVASNATRSTVSVPVDSGDDITCTITNSRLPQIKVVKDMVPDTDPGRFDLNIDTTSYDNSGNGFGDNGTTNFHNVTTGSHTVEEFAHTGTSLSKYSSKVYCDSGKGSTNPGTSKTFTVGYGDKVTCTITNTRNKGKLTVKKTLVPAIDSGRFDLSIDTTVVKANAGDGGSGFQMLDPGTYSVSEAAGTTAPATVLSNYDRSVVCKDAGGTTVASNTTGAAINVSVDSNDDITCTFTNKRRPMLIVQKLIKPDRVAYELPVPDDRDRLCRVLACGWPAKLADARTRRLHRQGDRAARMGTHRHRWLERESIQLHGDRQRREHRYRGVCRPRRSVSVSSTATRSPASSRTPDRASPARRASGRRTRSWPISPGSAVRPLAMTSGPGSRAWRGSADKLLCPGLNPPVTAAKNIDTLGKLMGAFWSDVSRSPPVPAVEARPGEDAAPAAVDRGRAERCRLGTRPSSRQLRRVGDRVLRLEHECDQHRQSQAASFNTAGDSGQFTPGTSADSQGAKQGANLAFWDILP